MSKKAYIYTLEDPTTGEVRYVGKAINPQHRYKSHLKDKSETYKTRWIRSLQRRGLSPSLGILEEIEDGCGWEEAERFWIESLKHLGCNLTNLTSGGEGVADLNPESLARKSAKLKGRTISWGAKISIANKGRVITKEWKIKIGQGCSGKKMSPETRERMAAVRRLHHRRKTEGHPEFNFQTN